MIVHHGEWKYWLMLIDPHVWETHLKPWKARLSAVRHATNLTYPLTQLYLSQVLSDKILELPELAWYTSVFWSSSVGSLLERQRWNKHLTQTMDESVVGRAQQDFPIAKKEWQMDPWQYKSHQAGLERPNMTQQKLKPNLLCFCFKEIVENLLSTTVTTTPAARQASTIFGPLSNSEDRWERSRSTPPVAPPGPSWKTAAATAMTTGRWRWSLVLTLQAWLVNGWRLWHTTSHQL